MTAPYTATSVHLATRSADQATLSLEGHGIQATNGRTGHSMSSDTTMQDDTGTATKKSLSAFDSASKSSLSIESLVHPTSKSLMQVGTGTTTHAAPKKELAETVRHGTSVFPFAAYIWEPQSFTSRVPLHWHREIELVRFSGAEYEIAVDMHNVVIKDDAFLLLPGNIMHTFTLPANCQESAIVFDPTMLAFSSYDEVQSEILEPLISSKIPLPPIITTEHPAFNRIDKLYRYCVRNGGTTNASQRLLIKAKLLEILAIYHEYGLLSRKEMHVHKTTTKQDKLKELLNYVDTHYAGPITIRDASLRLGVTDQYFCRYFRRVTGMSFTEYLNDLRLRRASKEIELTNRSISDIAFDHGFENAGYFFKNFKQKFGITPLRYRKKYLKENNAYGISNFGNHSTTLNPTDADHTSAMHESDINTLTAKATDTSKENKKFTSQGLIQASESEKEVEEYYRNSIVSPYINADDEMDAITSNRAAEAAAEATAQAIAKARAEAAAKGETLTNDAIAAIASGQARLQRSLYDSATSSASSGLNCHGATSTKYNASDASAASVQSTTSSHTTELDDEVEYYEDEYESLEDDGDITSAFSTDNGPNSEFVDSSIIKVATTQEEINQLLKTGRIKHLEASDSEDELFDDDEDDIYVSPADSEIRHDIEQDLRSNAPIVPIKSPLQELADRHTRGSTASSRRLSTAKGNETSENDRLSDGDNASQTDGTRKMNFVSALEAYQNERTLRNSQRPKPSAKSQTKSAKTSAKSLKRNDVTDSTTKHSNASSSSKHSLGRLTKSSPASRHTLAPTDLPDEDRSLTGLSTFNSSTRQTHENQAARTLQQSNNKSNSSSKPVRKYALGTSFEDDEMESSSEILRRAMENKLKTDSSYSAEKQQKSDKPVNRAELRAKIAELEARNKNDDPFSI